jgi:hypothetical protein
VGLGVEVSGDALYNETSVTLSYAENIDRFLMIIEGFNVGLSAKLQFAGFGNNKENEDDDKVKGARAGLDLTLARSGRLTATYRLLLSQKTHSHI